MWAWVSRLWPFNRESDRVKELGQFFEWSEGPLGNGRPITRERVFEILEHSRGPDGRISELAMWQARDLMTCEDHGLSWHRMVMGAGEDPEISRLRLITSARVEDWVMQWIRWRYTDDQG